MVDGKIQTELLNTVARVMTPALLGLCLYILQGMKLELSQVNLTIRRVVAQQVENTTKIKLYHEEK